MIKLNFGSNNARHTAAPQHSRISRTGSDADASPSADTCPCSGTEPFSPAPNKCAPARRFSAYRTVVARHEELSRRLHTAGDDENN